MKTQITIADDWTKCGNGQHQKTVTANGQLIGELLKGRGGQLYAFYNAVGYHSCSRLLEHEREAVPYFDRVHSDCRKMTKASDLA